MYICTYMYDILYNHSSDKYPFVINKFQVVEQVNITYIHKYVYIYYNADKLLLIASVGLCVCVMQTLVFGYFM